MKDDPLPSASLASLAADLEGGLSEQLRRALDEEDLHWAMLELELPMLPLPGWTLAPREDWH